MISLRKSRVLKLVQVKSYAEVLIKQATVDRDTASSVLNYILFL